MRYKYIYMATTKKKTVKKKLSNGTNVRITEESFKLIKDFCFAKGYKIGAFVEKAALKSVSFESIQALKEL